MAKSNKKFLTGLAIAAIAGVYFLLGNNAKKHRKSVRGWYLKAKGEVLEKIELAKNIDKESYMNIIDNVAKRYRKFKNVSSRELSAMVSELRSNWSDIQKELNKKTRK